jgi:hypothetical protein
MAIVLTNAGKGIITNRIKAGGTEPNNIGWGTGVATATATDTALGTPQSPARVAGTSTQQTTTTTNDTYRVVGTVTAGGTIAVTEAGLFDGAGTGLPPTGATLFIRGDFAALNLVSGDSITFTFNVVFA